MTTSALRSSASKPARHPNPEGGAHGCAPFSDRAMDGEYENTEGLSGRRIDLSGRPFLFGDFFFGPAKKKLLGRGSGRRSALSRKHQRRWIPAFAGMTSKNNRGVGSR
jgi:hypothetical protein